MSSPVPGGSDNGGNHETTAAKSDRERLLEAAVEQLTHGIPGDEHRYPTLRRLVNAKQVYEAAGVSRTAFYRRFPNDTFYAALAEHILDVDRVSGINAVREVISDVLLAGGDLTEIARVGATVEFEAEQTQEGRHLLLAIFGAAADDQETQAAARKLYGDLTDRACQLYGQVLEYAQREPRPPLTLRDIAAIFSALIDGMLIRHHIDPGALPSYELPHPGGRSVDHAMAPAGRWEFFPLVIQMLLPALTVPADADPEDSDDPVAWSAKQLRLPLEAVGPVE